METTLSGLFIVAVGGIAWFAYEHPDDYKKIYCWLAAFCFMVATCIELWNGCVGKTYSVLYPFIEQSKEESAIAAKASLLAPSWILLLAQAATPYVILLRGFALIERRGRSKQ